MVVFGRLSLDKVANLVGELCDFSFELRLFGKTGGGKMYCSAADALASYSGCLFLTLPIYV
ncbi:hypothetical protein EON63_00085 [archaeon]|nr:MAG: hypothetical protein EON63_00085 [archaeon]